MEGIHFDEVVGLIPESERDPLQWVLCPAKIQTVSRCGANDRPIIQSEKETAAHQHIGLTLIFGKLL